MVCQWCVHCPFRRSFRARGTGTRDRRQQSDFEATTTRTETITCTGTRTRTGTTTRTAYRPSVEFRFVRYRLASFTGNVVCHCAVQCRVRSLFGVGTDRSLSGVVLIGLLETRSFSVVLFHRKRSVLGIGSRSREFSRLRFLTIEIRGIRVPESVRVYSSRREREVIDRRSRRQSIAFSSSRVRPRARSFDSSSPVPADDSSCVRRGSPDQGGRMR